MVHKMLCWRSACVISSVLLVASVQAQTKTPDTAAKAAYRDSIEEVLVTARKREENLQETPIAISAISGDQLREQGITNMLDLTKMVPSLEIRRGQANQIYIRGIGERTGFARVDPAVGVYLDDIFLPRSDGQLLDTVDVRSIQVLRGPQGTLFGKNTTGGAMVLNVVKAHDGEEAFVEAGLGNYNSKRFKAGFNRPLSDELFFRAVVNVVKDDGWFENLDQNRNNPTNDRQALILQSRWEPSVDFGLDALLFYGKARENFPGINCKFINEDALLVRGLWLNYPGDTDPSNPQALKNNCDANSREVLGDLKGRQGPNPQLDKDMDTYLLGLTGDWSVSDTSEIKVVFSARDSTEGPIQASDADGGPALWSSNVNPNDSDRASYSLELQFNGSAFEERLQYTLGIFGMHETNTENFTSSNVLTGIDAQTLAQLANGGPLTQPAPTGTVPVVGMLLEPIRSSDFALENTTFAAFSQMSLAINEDLELTLGARFTREKRSSELTVTLADKEAISNRMISTGLFGPGVDGLHPYLGPLGWLADPVGFAASLYSDADGDALLDYPMDPSSAWTDTNSEVFSELTPMASLAWTVPEQWFADSALDSTLLYLTWSSGFKSGFFEPRGIDGLQRIDPETVENIEMGLKLEAFDRRLRFNSAIYTMDYDNMQLIQVGSDSAGSLVVVFANAGRSRIDGAEFEVQWLPLPGWVINASLSANTYRFVDFTEPDLNQAVLGNEILLDRTDETFPVSPEQSASLGVQYSMPLANGTLTPRLDFSYKSDIFYGFDPGSNQKYEEDIELAGQPAYVLVDARLSWQNEADDFGMALWVKNATDERYLIGVASVADSSATFTQGWGQPRMYGVEFFQTF